MPTLTDTKTEKVASLIRSKHPPEIRDLLVVGCGSGLEAAILAEQLEAQVIGIDLKDEFLSEAKAVADLRKGDALNLEFEDESFDFVFSYHALEHIAEPAKALSEIHRALRKGGGFWVGTPNRSRIIGYVGSKDTSLAEKIRWNLADWRFRLRGKFRNEHGAHAGFTSKELGDLLSSEFPKVEDVTSLYFSKIYEKHHSLLRLIEWLRLSGYVYPSVYFMGMKE